MLSGQLCRYFDSKINRSIRDNKLNKRKVFFWSEEHMRGGRHCNFTQSEFVIASFYKLLLKSKSS